MEGNTAYLVNPLATDVRQLTTTVPDTISWKDGTGPAPGKHNRLRIEGPGILTESFAWDEINKQGDILDLVEDLNLTTTDSAEDRGNAILRKIDIEHLSGFIRIPVNCGQQLYDIIEITDSGAGLANSKRRILGIALSHIPQKGEYEQKLILGGV